MLTSKCCGSELYEYDEDLKRGFCLRCDKQNELKMVISDEKDLIDKPSHYAKHDLTCKCGNVIKCLELTETYNFRLGNALKYIIRCNDKSTKEQDLNKAIFYLKRELEKSGLRYEGDR